MTHVIWLTNLAPDIQEAILFLPRVESGPDIVKEIDVRRIARVMDWGVQRRLWYDIVNSRSARYHNRIRILQEHLDDDLCFYLSLVIPWVMAQSS